MLNEKQARFVIEYLNTPDAARAYRAAGYRVTSAQSAASAGNRLLKNVQVARALNEARTARTQRMAIDSDWVVQRLVLVQDRALGAGDHRAAVAALIALGKHFGTFERDTTPKRKSPEEIARMKAELEMMGMDFTRKNFPPELIGVEPGDPPRVLLGALPDDAVINDNAPQDDPDEPSDERYPHHTVASDGRTR